MLRHLAFFEELGKMNENDSSWRAVSAGLVVMRLVDQWIEDGPRKSRVDTWAVGAVRESIAQVADTTPVRRILTSIVDAMVSTNTVDMHSLCPRLMAYGQALDYDAKWSLAADVYATIVAHAHPVEDSDLVVAANLQLGYCLRTTGELELASSAFAQAANVAQHANDLIGVLRSRLGDARIAMARGNMPRAESLVDQAIEDAKSHNLQEVHATALIDRAFIAGAAAQYDRVIRYSYAALELSTSQRRRDRILNNIATGFRFLGLMDNARDAYLVLAATAEEQYIRWTAELNLMELAASQGIEIQFDRYRRDLESADFTPQLRVTYLLHAGRGYHSLGEPEKAVPYLERAIEMADKHQLNQLLFEAEAALTEARSRRVGKRLVEAETFDPSIQPVIDAIHEMKELAAV
jgi:tetratricopeptide (TPR) repeat protein